MWFNDLGLYYVHGRCYNPDIGRFISPDDKGEFLYGSGDDAINSAWVGNGGSDSGYSCNTLTGCNIRIPIQVDCAKNSCLLDSRLDKAVLFYSNVYGIPPDLLGATLATEVQTDTPWYEPPINRAVQDSASLAVSNNPFLRFMGTLNISVYDWGERIHGSPGVGNQNYHIDPAREVEGYFHLTYGGDMSYLVKPGCLFQKNSSC